MRNQQIGERLLLKMGNNVRAAVVGSGRQSRCKRIVVIMPERENGGGASVSIKNERIE